MGLSTTQFITQMKLRELRRQRAKLRAAYDGLRTEVDGADGDGHRLQTLYEGLQQLTFAGQPLHPDVVNLEILCHEVDSGVASPDVLALWLGRLEEELAAGQARSEIVYLFGALLEEWARGEVADERLSEEGRLSHDRLLGQAVADVEPNSHHEVLAPLFARLGETQSELAKRLEEHRARLEAPVSVSELTAVLERLAANIYRPANVRREARRFEANRELRKELADALTILIAELPTWDWPKEGGATRALWTRNKWRLYLEEDLPVACLLEILGNRWVGLFDQLFGDRSLQITERKARLQKLLDLNAPEVIVENDRRMLRLAEQMIDLGCPEGIDVWNDGDPAPDAAWLTPESGSVAQKRASHQASLRHLSGAHDYEEGYSEVNRAVQLVHAEVQLARAAYPDRPLYVVKVDLQDFYPSLPHDVLLTVLRQLGVAEDHHKFFARFLTPPLRVEGQKLVRMQRGVPMGHALSGMLAELLMRLLEQHIQQHARVRIVRIVDDLCVLTPDAEAAVAAWKRIESFCEACGLHINQAKSGALCLGGVSPDSLPSARPRWGMLELDELGQWHVHMETFEAHLEQSRLRLASAASILSRVQVYNANLTYLLNAVGLGGELGDTHRTSAEHAILRYHHAFFGPDRGIVDELKALIRQRFLTEADADAAIPEAWIYWPITAGGLALRNPLVVAGQYAKADRDSEPAPALETRSTGWDLQANEWGAYYGRFLDPIPPLEPQETKLMKTLLDDFIARGADLSDGRQHELAPYWRWILCTYGPQILRRFGTFRFLITELVPLQLISRQLVQDSSLGDAERFPMERE